MEPLGFPSAEAIVTVGRVAIVSRSWKILDVPVVLQRRNRSGACGDAMTLVELAAAFSAN